MKYRDRHGQLQEAELALDKGGLYYRKNTSDRAMIRDCQNNYGPLLERLLESDVLLDLGANVGAFSAMAAPLVSKVIAVEAEFLNHEMVVLNTQRFTNAYAQHGAVVADGYTEDTVTFEVMGSNQNACSGRVNEGKIRSDRTALTVPVLRFSELIEKHGATALKIDIEGGEYGILDKEIPSSIRIIGGELHGMGKATGEKMIATHEKLIADGWIFDLEDWETIFSRTGLLNFVCHR